MKEFTITPATAGQRLNKVLQKIMPGAASSLLYKSLRKKNITVNDKRADGAYVVKEGDVIRIWFSNETFAKFSGRSEVAAGAAEKADTSQRKRIREQGPDLPVLYEDADLLFVNKPAGLLVQPDRQHTDSLLQLVDTYLTHEAGEEGLSPIFRPGPANRLDRNTSGIVAFGKTIRGQQFLAKQFRERSMKKFYLALVKGEIAPCQDELLIRSWFVKDHKANTAHIYDQKPADPSAVPVELAILPLSSTKAASLLRVHLLTGKSHQIRAQLAAKGHPLAGDPKYGDRSWNAYLAKKYGLKFQLLHAWQLELNGLNGQALHISAPLPEHFSRVLRGEKLWVPGIPEGCGDQRSKT